MPSRILTRLALIAGLVVADRFGVAPAYAAGLPDPQAIIDRTADAYFNQGVLGATVVLLLLLLGVAGWIIRTLYRDLRACNAVALTDRGDLIKAVEASRDAAERFLELLRSVQGTLDARGQTAIELSHQVEMVAQKVQHGLGNLAASMEAVARWIEAQRQREIDRAEKEAERARERGDGRDRGRS